MDRTALLTSLFDPSGFGLEIGPGYNPLLAKRDGYRVETLDYTDAEGLRTKYRNAAVDLSRIEDVTYVSDGRPMVDIIGQRARYDFIIASHVIEHVPNLVGFLNDCDALLADGGVLVLAVPDKRHCFDVLQAISTAGDVLQAFHEGRTRHPPGAVFDEIAYGALRGGKPGWGFGERGRFSFFHELSKAKLMFDQACQPAPAYVDIHAWRFTPSSFRLILRDLADVGVTRLREARFVDSVGIEFYATLTAGGAGCPVDRVELARRVLAEERQVALD